MEFVALDDQPFSVVEDVEFQSLEHTEPHCSLPSHRHFVNIYDVGANVLVMGFLLMTFLP